MCNLDESYKGHIKRLTINDASERNLQLFFSLPKRLFSDLYRLVIREYEPIESVIEDILSNGRLTNLKLGCEPVGYVVGDFLSDGWIKTLKQLCFHGKSLQVSCNLESLFASHPNLVHIGIGNSFISSSDMLALCKYISSRSQSGSPEFTLALTQNSIDSELLRLLISAVAFRMFLLIWKFLLPISQ